MRDNPLKWDDEAPQGVLAPFEGVDGLSPPPSLLGLPSGSSWLTARSLRSDAMAGPSVRATLDEVATALSAASAGQGGWRRYLSDVSENDRAMVFDALGEGEVSILISAAATGAWDAQIQESVLPGVWIGRAIDETGTVRSEIIEVGSAPRALVEAADLRPRPTLPLDQLTPPAGAMNVMSILAEIRDRALAWTPGERNHVMNFTLMPMTPADSAFLAETLGEVGVRVTSGGYGTARVIMTAVKNVWAIQFVNGVGTVILDTVEVGGVPDAILASREDFEDSAERLASILKGYQA